MKPSDSCTRCSTPSCGGSRIRAFAHSRIRAFAHSRIRRSGDITLLDTTSLVHESYLRFEKSAHWP